MNNNWYAVLMAGGVGSRFWPVSTTENPKQFHDMLGSGKTLIQKTFDRLARFIPTKNIFILTNTRYNDLVLEQLPQLTQEQLVLEPAMRNTAPCILYAALKIQKKNPNALMLVAPSDHWIEDEAAFEADVKICFSRCEQQNILCTLGIQPTFPNTGFGYIEFEQGSANQLKKVVQFREKPAYETAKAFVAQGNFLWNAGIFIWSVHTIVEAFKAHQPRQYQLFQQGWDSYNTAQEQTFIAAHYAKADNISIDYAIMEHSSAIYTLPATFDWNDLGTWSALCDELYTDEAGNTVVHANTILENAKGNIIHTPKGKVVVIKGLENYIVVDKEEVLLIYPKAKPQEIKKVRSQVQEKFGNQFT